MHASNALRLLSAGLLFVGTVFANPIEKRSLVNVITDAQIRGHPPVQSGPIDPANLDNINDMILYLRGSIGTIAQLNQGQCTIIETVISPADETVLYIQASAQVEDKSRFSTVLDGVWLDFIGYVHAGISHLESAVQGTTTRNTDRYWGRIYTDFGVTNGHNIGGLGQPGTTGNGLHVTVFGSTNCLY